MSLKTMKLVLLATNYKIKFFAEKYPFEGVWGRGYETYYIQSLKSC